MAHRQAGTALSRRGCAVKTCLVCFRPTGHPTRSRCPECQARNEAGRARRHPQRAAYKDPGYRAYRETVLRDRPPCHLCGLAGADTVDHLVPLVEGGTNDRANLAPAHRACNSRRRSVL